MKYIDQFLSLNCAPDILAATGKINNAAKEITEVMAMISQMRSLVLAEPMKWTLLDLCAGNGLLGLTAVHLLPFKEIGAVDTKYRKVKTEVKRYFRLQADIYNEDEFWRVVNPLVMISKKIIIVSCHCCKDLAWQIIKLYKDLPPNKALFMMPCCIGTFRTFNENHIITKHLGKYLTWTLDLALSANLKIKQDKCCISPANVILGSN